MSLRLHNSDPQLPDTYVPILPLTWPEEWQVPEYYPKKKQQHPRLAANQELGNRGPVIRGNTDLHTVHSWALLTPPHAWKRQIWLILTCHHHRYGFAALQYLTEIQHIQASFLALWGLRFTRQQASSVTVPIQVHRYMLVCHKRAVSEGRNLDLSLPKRQSFSTNWASERGGRVRISKRDHDSSDYYCYLSSESEILWSQCTLPEIGPFLHCVDFTQVKYRKSWVSLL